MGWILNILGAPLVGPLKLTQWMAEKIQDVANQQLGGEEHLKAELIELQMKLEMEEISAESYNKREKEILERIKTLKAEKGGSHD